MVTPGINKNTMNLSKRIFHKVEKLEEVLAQEIISILDKDIKEYQEAKLLLSGGSTPVNLYTRLSEFDINWEQVTIGLVDERFVSADDLHSNERMIKNSLIQGKASKAKFIGLLYDANDLNKNVELVLEQNKPFFEGTSCVLLGMGTDGHTASLFPNDKNSIDGLEEKKNSKPLIVTNAPVKPRVRISYTTKQLLKTKKLVLYFTGDEKMKVFSDAKTYNRPITTPISSFIHQQERLLEVFWTV
jgi:6-phosphogluconolactonase